MVDNKDSSQPSWGATIGVYFLCLLVMGVTTAVSSLMISYGVGQGGYGVGGILSWLCSLACAAYYRSTGKVGTAVLIAVSIGVVLGAITAFAAPQLYNMRYGR